ncbi:MAG: DUF3298 domain-containing protein [Oscillibacter sp.]|nr:DUF3298 domain-containing protein [Oscillibacter sp.]
MRNGSEFTVEAAETARTWDVDGVPVLEARATLPRPAGKERKYRRIASFYRLQGDAFLKYCRRELRPWTETEYRAALLNSGPLPCFQATLTFQETYRAGRLWSLYTELRENAAPGPPFQRRWGDTWDLVTGYPVALSDFFPPRTRWKKTLCDFAAEEIECQEKRGLSRYHPDWRRRLRRCFQPRNYFLTPEGLVFFFPMYALAPAAEGVPRFLYPWDGDAPVQPLRM